MRSTFWKEHNLQRITRDIAVIISDGLEIIREDYTVREDKA